MDGSHHESLKNVSLVGGCYDILKIDPLDISLYGTKFARAFAFEEFEDLPDQTASKPVALEYLPAYGGGSDRVVSEFSSATDFQDFLRTQATVGVSDAAGKLFCATASASYESLSHQTTERGRVLTSVSERVNRFRLRLSDNSGLLFLSPEIEEALRGLPVEGGPEFDAFIARFGTHYLKSALYGGRATLRMSVTTEDYSSLVEQKVDVSAEAKATFELVSANGKVGREDKRSRKFVESRSLTVERMVYVGGYTQESLDMWAMTVPEQPMPIEAEFEPLHRLLTPTFLPDLDLDALRRTAGQLASASELYLARNGRDTRVGFLGYGDVVEIELQGPGPRRVLSSDKVGTVSTATLAPGAGRPGTQWRLRAPGIRSGEGIPVGEPVLLESLASGQFLDARAGRDADYGRGDGLTAALGTDPAAESSLWWPCLLASMARTRLADGDLAAFRVKNPRRRLAEGYLLGEPDPDQDVQRVYGFGREAQAGTAWRLRRVEAAA